MSETQVKGGPAACGPEEFIGSLAEVMYFSPHQEIGHAAKAFLRGVKHELKYKHKHGKH